jgi:hypothetical protein
LERLVKADESMATNPNQGMVDQATDLAKECDDLARAYTAASQKDNRNYRILGGTVVVLSAVAGVSAIAKFDPHNYIATALAVAVAVVGGLATYLNLGSEASKCQGAASSFNSVKDNFTTFAKTDCSLPTANPTQLESDLKSLIKAKNDITGPILPVSVSSRNPSVARYMTRMKGL